MKNCLLAYALALSVLLAWIHYLGVILALGNTGYGQAVAVCAAVATFLAYAAFYLARRATERAARICLFTVYGVFVLANLPNTLAWACGAPNDAQIYGNAVLITGSSQVGPVIMWMLLRRWKPFEVC